VRAHGRRQLRFTQSTGALGWSHFTNLSPGGMAWGRTARDPPTPRRRVAHNLELFSLEDERPAKAIGPHGSRGQLASNSRAPAPSEAYQAVAEQTFENVPVCDPQQDQVDEDAERCEEQEDNRLGTNRPVCERDDQGGRSNCG